MTTNYLKYVFVTLLTISSFAEAGVIPLPRTGDVSSAFIEWSGYAKVIPGDNIVITGKNSGPVEDGVLTVQGDGTFETKIPIDLESRLYWDQDGSGTKTPGEKYATNWKINNDGKGSGITVQWGSNITAGINPIIIDLNSNKILNANIMGAENIYSDSVRLSVVNEQATITPPENLLQPLKISATIVAIVA